jgi:DNA-directed RNA polymerase I subunit RPA2
MPGAPLPRDPASAVASTSASVSALKAKSQKYSFGTLEREKRFRNPSTTKHDVPALEELVAPHIQSFDALFSDPVTGKGLLELAVNDITSKVIYDGKGKEQGRLGNRLESKSAHMPGNNSIDADF